MNSDEESNTHSEDEQHPRKGITRKSFLKGSLAAMIGAAAAAATEGVAATAPTPAADKKPVQPAAASTPGKKRSFITHEADVVVIGGGVAGLAAAREAIKAGRTVILVDKGPSGHSGGSGMNWGHTFVTNEFYNGDVKDSIIPFLVDCSGMIDQENFLALCKAGKEARPVAYGEQCGSVQQRNDKGMLVHMDDGGPITDCYEYRNRHAAQHVLRSGVSVYDNTMLVDIVLSGKGELAGAVGLNLYTGEAHFFRTKALVMATGGYIWATGGTINSPELTGEGHAAFIRHGLAMKDMEFFHADLEAFRPMGSRRKAKNQVEVSLSAALNGETWDKLYNKYGKSVAKGFFMDPKLSAYPGAAFLGTVITSAKDIMQGKGTPGDGSGNGIMMDVSGWPGNPNLGISLYAGQVQDVEGAMGGKYPKLVECIPDFYGSCGMPKVNPNTMETGIPGLFSAVHNITELASFTAFTQGTVAGKAAAEKAANAPMPEFSSNAVQDILNHTYGLLESEPAHPLRSTEVCDRIQTAFYKGFNLIRNEKDMQASLDEFLRIQKEDIPRMCVPHKTKQFNRDWRNAVEAESMLLCSIGTAYASLFRKETRPFHFRSDYPVMDNDNWLVNVWVKPRTQGSWSVSTTPIVDTIIPAEKVKKMIMPLDMRIPNIAAE